MVVLKTFIYIVESTESELLNNLKTETCFNFYYSLTT